jgi:hypothetical protein
LLAEGEFKSGSALTLVERAWLNHVRIIAKPFI